MSTIELLAECIKNAEKIERDFLVDFTPKQFKRVRMKFATTPGKTWKCEVLAALAKDVVEPVDGPTVCFAFLAKPHTKPHQPESIERRHLVIQNDRLIGRECRWINKSCYRIAFKGDNGRVCRVDFFHDQKGIISLIHAF